MTRRSLNLYGNNIIKEMECANFFEEKFGSIKVLIILYPYMDYSPSEGDSYLAAEGGDDEWVALGIDSIFVSKKVDELFGSFSVFIILLP